MQPQWQPSEVVSSNGEIEAMQTLNIGPVTWYWSPTHTNGGLAQNEDQRIKTAVAFSGGRSDQLQTLQQSNTGQITFDPSLTRAVAMSQQKESAAQHIVKGGLWVIPILLFALFALSIAILKTVQLWRLPKIRSLSSGQLQRAINGDASVVGDLNGMQKQLLHIARDEDKSQARDDQLFTQLQRDQHWLNRWLGAIAITASVSPLLGLLGTVSGMIETFKMMTLFGSGDPEVVSGGIAQALITTELGLVVAIPALILNAVLSRQAKNYYHALENFAVQLSQLQNQTNTPLHKHTNLTPSQHPEEECA